MANLVVQVEFLGFANYITGVEPEPIPKPIQENPRRLAGAFLRVWLPALEGNPQR